MERNLDKRLRLLQIMADPENRVIMIIELVLLGLVLVSPTFPGVDVEERSGILSGLYCYSAFLVSAWAIRRVGYGGDWLLLARTVAMIVISTWAMWFTDKLESPLRNAYLLVIIATALARGMRPAMIHVLLVAAGVVVLEEARALEYLLSISYLGSLLARVVPLVVVAYLASRYAFQFRFDSRRSQLVKAVDPMTGLNDLTGFAIAADWFLSVDAQHGDATTLLLIGLDDIPGIVARDGPDASTRAVRAIADLLSTAHRRGDVAARCGDDEFVLLLSGTPLGAARMLADRIRGQVNSQALVMARDRLEFHVSIGLVERGGAADTLLDMLDRANRALVMARGHGGNRIAEG